MSKTYLLTNLISLFCLSSLLGQNQYPQNPIHIKKASAKIVLDGEISESAWSEGQHAQNFWSLFPVDTTQAEYQTEIYMTYDENHLYIAAKCFSGGEKYITPSLRRDFRAGGNDNITFLFDPFNEQNNAFVFGINPFGVKREALISNGGRNPSTDWDSSWDNKWEGVSKIEEGFWTCELAIPFSSIRYNEGVSKWRFNAYRFDTQSNCTSTWIRIPRNQFPMDLGYMGTMHWEEPPPAPGSNISLIPYTSGGYLQEFDPERTDAEYNLNIGGDAKIGITSGLNLDLTINPDFSQVEVDQQVTNLDRFEIFFPERRQFFLENADLFGRFGDPMINPFFSRRIGIAFDTTLQQNIQNQILFGARLSGKLNNQWRIGLLNMQAAKDESNDLPSFNYLVGAIQRKVSARSNVGMIFVNKETFEDFEGNEQVDPFNRVVGIDYNLASKDNTLTGKTFLHRSFSFEDKKEPFAHGLLIQKQTRKFRAQWAHQWVGAGFDAQVGFVPRTNFFNINPVLQYYFYPDKGILNTYGPGLDALVLFTPGQGRTDHRINLFFDYDARSTARGRIGIVHQYTYLLNDFDPTRVGDVELAADTDYNYIFLTGLLSSDRRKRISYMLMPNLGQFFDGWRWGTSGTITFRSQPNLVVALNLSYNHIDLPAAAKPTDLLLIGPRIDFTFTRNFFLTTFVQYNNQIQNVNVNARLQWRYAPVSDFYLVYTDNYYSTDFKAKNRFLVAKLTYWLNL